ncbi:MAG: hypothetical protein HN475_06975 [Piscirickettsiaceae bacterium]|jgi:hypothetical protein|nr:hypothetical protein [Piscirickettsiaceae bacterium]
MFTAAIHKPILLEAFSVCLDPIRSDLGNIHPDARQSPYISGAILGTCRGYAIKHKLRESVVNKLIDNAFEEVFRSESLDMQTTAQAWLNNEDADFMAAYYHAKAIAEVELNLDWLSQYVQTHFEKASTLGQHL